MNIVTRFRRKKAIYRAGNQPARQVELGKGQVFQKVEPLQVQQFGLTTLDVPPDTVGVLTVSDKESHIYHSGINLVDWPAGRYPLTFVDSGPRLLELTGVAVKSSDGLPLMFDLRVPHHVRVPAQVIRLDDPEDDLEAVVETAARHVAQRYTHDELIPVPGGKPLEEAFIASAILEKVQATCNCTFLTVDGLVLTGRQGDKERIEIAEKLKRADAQKELAQKEAEIERVRREEKDRARLQEAQTTVNESQLLQPLADEKLKIKREEDERERQHQREMKELKGRVEVLKAALTPTATGAAWRPQPEEPSIGDMLFALTDGLSPNGSTRQAAPPPADAPPTQPTPLHQRLLVELGDLLLLPEKPEGTLQQAGPGQWQAHISIRGLCLRIVCGPGYPSKPPRAVFFSKVGSSLELPAQGWSWVAGMTLRHLVRQIIDMVSDDMIMNSEGENGNKDRPMAI